MFQQLREKLQLILRPLRGRGVLSENHIQGAVQDIHMAFLAADVHVDVAQQLTRRIADRARSEDCIKGLRPTEQFTKIVYEELTAVLGGQAAEFSWRGAQPIVILCAGLQGSGKTTTIAKLALAATRNKRRPVMVPLDLARPAAIEQLQGLGRQLSLDVYPTPAQGNPEQIAREAVAYATRFGFDTVYLDTAGRLAIDDALMTELRQVVEAVNPLHRFLVVDAMAGQSGLSTAKRFDEVLHITGAVLTKADGDARGGVALSVTHALGRPIYYIGTGERPTDLESFYPDRMAARILDLGDIKTLMEKTQAIIPPEEAKTTAKGMISGQFSLDEFRRQLRMMKKLGSMESMLKLLPGGGRLIGEMDVIGLEKELKVKETILDSMTRSERQNPKVLNGSRRMRIAKGSGRSVQEVNRLMKEFDAMQTAFKRMRGGKMQALQQMFGR